MPQNKSITFSNNDTFNTSLIEVVGNKAQLVDGQLIPNSTFWATYTSSVNGSGGLGDLTGTAVGNATITNQQLDLSFNDLSYVSYSGVGNASYTQTGAIKFKYTPNFNTVPPTNMCLFLSEETGTQNNLIEIQHTDSGFIVHTIYDSSGVQLGFAGGAFPVTLLQTYEIELNFDCNSGGFELFIDGVSLSLVSINGTRTTTTNNILLGTDPAMGKFSEFFIEDLIIYNTVQHTSNYTPGYTLPDGTFPTSNPTIIPAASFNFKDFIEYLEDATKPSGTEIKYILQDGDVLKYWDGSNIVISDGSYDQSNTAVEIQDAKTLIQFVNPVKIIVFLNSDGSATPII